MDCNRQEAYKRLLINAVCRPEGHIYIILLGRLSYKPSHTFIYILPGGLGCFPSPVVTVLVVQVEVYPMG